MIMDIKIGGRGIFADTVLLYIIIISIGFQLLSFIFGVIDILLAL